MSIKLHEFSRADYYRMAESGVIPPNKRVELLNGRVAEMSPIGPLHGGVVAYLTRVLTTALGERALVNVQNPLVLDDATEPQPDIALLRPRADFYRTAHAQPSDALLVIEVAESSLDLDLGEKADLYARAGIPEYWVVDVVRYRLVVHREPGPAGYASVTELRRGATVAPQSFPDVTLATNDIFG